MNRRERRKRAKLGDIVEIRLARVGFDIKPGENTSRDLCYVCGAPATAWSYPRGGLAHGAAEISDGRKQQIVLLCEACFAAEEKNGGAIIRKYWEAPDLTTEKGGAYESVDQLRRDIANASKKRGGRPTN
jgi:hypothetical protein